MVSKAINVFNIMNNLSMNVGEVTLAPVFRKMNLVVDGVTITLNTSSFHKKSGKKANLVLEGNAKCVCCY